ncbi:MAG: Holliday junction branch migration protein RuvA [Chloroflexi bacterium]|jgi:Holliday junction DNA helicase RuvA|nr:Holliday junction branch migration protein RuvA [Anaerolineaceae bacterium]NMB89848.1 Holliday junction branch migration protein RuvA [Chloroflexota bacterium]
MIAALEGRVISTGDGSLVVMVGGIGLQVFVTNLLCSQTYVDETLFLYTHMVVRQDLLALYGFRDAEEREFFRLLLGVNGVGPKLALSILSSMNVDAIRRSVLSEQPDLMARVPGVGKKTAQKILLQLQGRMGKESLLENLPAMNVDAEVLDALTALGYSIVEGQAAIQSIPRDAPADVESRLRLALQYFSG